MGGNMPIRRVRQSFAIWTCLFFLFASGAARAAATQPPSPAAIAGVMTRWQTTSKTACAHTYNDDADETACPRSLMFTITPNLAGLTLRDWVKTLASEGVNTGVIYVIPAYRLAATSSIDDATWKAYNQYLYLPPATLTDRQKQVILTVGEAISQREYTAAQRNYAILVFLTQLQAAFPSATPMQFILDERIWFISHLNANGKPIPLALSKVFSLEQDYSDDIAGIVNAAKQQGLDHWLSGARLSEYASKDWNLMGPVMVDLVTEINAKSSGWMKTHSFIGAGGGWGQDWEAVDAMQCPTTSGWQFAACTGDFPFFQYMGAQVGYFAFGDKFMEFGKPEAYLLNGKDSGLTYTYITGEIADFCQKNTRKYVCADPTTPSVKDWEAFLEDDKDGLGFSDLIHFMRINAKDNPQLANVIFEGDNSDSIATMTLPVSVNGATALGNLFNAAAQGGYQDVEQNSVTKGLHLGSWSGRIFLDGFDDTSSIPRPSFYGDAGYSMFDTDYKDFMFAPATVQIIRRSDTIDNWRHWP
jgi:hypothetical protein